MKGNVILIIINIKLCKFSRKILRKINKNNIDSLIIYSFSMILYELKILSLKNKNFQLNKITKMTLMPF